MTTRIANADPSREPLLSVRGVSKRFGGIRALEDVTFSVPGGEVTGLIGPNGAGKTTLLSIISGSQRPDVGSVTLAGRRIDGVRPDRIVRQRLIRTYQHISLSANLTIIENVMVGRHVRTSGGLTQSLLRLRSSHIERGRARVRAAEVLNQVDVKESEFDRYPSQLPYAQQRRTEIARALCADPALLLLDEPAAGMIQTESDQLLQLLHRLTNAGTTILLVEHNIQFVMDASNRIIVLNFGHKLAEGDPSYIQKHPEVIDAYLGED